MNKSLCPLMCMTEFRKFDKALLFSSHLYILLKLVLVSWRLKFFLLVIEYDLLRYNVELESYVLVSWRVMFVDVLVS